MTLNGTVIPLGGTTDEVFYLVSARLTDPDVNQLRLQVEVRQIGTAFISAAIGSSPFIASGGTAFALVGLPPAGAPGAAGSYHWQARTNDVNGASSDWVSFGANTEADTDFVCAPGAGAVPNVAAGADQYRSDGTTLIAVGGTTTESRVIFRATVTDPDAGNMVRLQVERRDINTTFTGSGLLSGSFVATGGVSIIEAAGIPSNSHYWRYRTQDAQGNVSVWTSFGGNLDNAPPGTPAEVDFIVNTAGNTAPAAPAAPGQLTTADVPIPTGSEAPTTVRFRGTLTDPDGDGVRLQVEVRPLATAFSNIQSAESALVASGSIATIDVGGLVEGSYHWQYRTVDGSGAATAWTPAGGNPDFVVPSSVVPKSKSHRNKLCGLLGMEVVFVLLLLRRRKS
jgi:hypothetical protein